MGLATGTEPARVFLTLGRHHRLFRAWLPFAATVLLRSTLPRRDVELVVLRTARNCSSAYEWVQHVPLAHRSGVPPTLIAAVGGDVTETDLTERDRLLMRAVDELHHDGLISTVTLAALGGHLDDRQVIELCMLVGQYEMLAMTLSTLGVDPELGALAKLDESTRSVAEQLRSAQIALARHG